MTISVGWEMMRWGNYNQYFFYRICQRSVIVTSFASNQRRNRPLTLKIWTLPSVGRRKHLILKANKQRKSASTVPPLIQMETMPLQLSFWGGNKYTLTHWGQRRRVRKEDAWVALASNDQLHWRKNWAGMFVSSSECSETAIKELLLQRLSAWLLGLYGCRLCLK